MIRLVFSNMEVFMRTLSKISIVLISVLMIFTLSISAFAVPNMHYDSTARNCFLSNLSIPSSRLPR